MTYKVLCLPSAAMLSL